MTLLNTYPQSGVATAAIALPGGQQILAANGEVSGVGIVNSQNGSMGSSIPAGCQAGIPALNGARTHIYVPDRCSQDITILNFTGQPAALNVHRDAGQMG